MIENITKRWITRRRCHKCRRKTLQKYEGRVIQDGHDYGLVQLKCMLCGDGNVVFVDKDVFFLKPTEICFEVWQPTKEEAIYKKH